ncbi:MAG: hypothetical protein QXR62_04785 [Candidatus Bathyarchaeia archaeon]
MKCSICGEVSVDGIFIRNPEQLAKFKLKDGDFVCMNCWHNKGFYERPPITSETSPTTSMEIVSMEILRLHEELSTLKKEVEDLRRRLSRGNNN